MRKDPIPLGTGIVSWKKMVRGTNGAQVCIVGYRPLQTRPIVAIQSILLKMWYPHVPRRTIPSKNTRDCAKYSTHIHIHLLLIIHRVHVLQKT